MSKHVKHVLGTETEVLLFNSYNNPVEIGIIIPCCTYEETEAHRGQVTWPSDRAGCRGSVEKQWMQSSFYEPSGQHRTSPYHTGQRICSEAMEATAGFLFFRFCFCFCLVSTAKNPT